MSKVHEKKNIQDFGHFDQEEDLPDPKSACCSD